MDFKSTDLSLILCPIREPDPEYKYYYEQIYSCWNLVWEAAYNEVKFKNENETLKSDAFTRQDFAAAIFHKNQCIAFILFRHIDLDLPSTEKDSFFQQWSEIHRKAVAKIGSRFLICGNLGVLPSFRQKSLGVSLKDLMGAIICEITLQSKVDATLSTPRRDRNVHEAAYRSGAIAIAQDISWGCGIQIDLVAFCDKNLQQQKNHHLSELMANLWLNKLVISEKIYEPVSFFKDKPPYHNQKFNKKVG